MIGREAPTLHSALQRSEERSHAKAKGKCLSARFQSNAGLIELRQLRFLAAAIDHGSLHRAASVLGVEQSTLSRSIAKLERVVGVKLLTRSRTGVVATSAGAEFICSARPMIAIAKRMLAEARSAGKRPNGRLTIGHASSISAGHLRTTIEDFREAFPDVEATPAEAPREVLLAGLDTGIVDIAVLSGDIPPRDLRTERVWNERLMSALPNSHHLAKHDRVTWADLGNETFVQTATDPGPAIAAMVRRRLSLDGHAPMIKMLNTSRESMLSMIGSGQDISIHCACSTGASYPDVTYREVHGAKGQSWVRYSAYWRGANDNPTLRRFLDFVRKRHSLSLVTP